MTPTPNTTEQMLRPGIPVTSFNVSAKEVEVFRQLQGNVCSQLNFTFYVIQAVWILLQITHSVLTTHQFAQEQLLP